MVTAPAKKVVFSDEVVQNPYPTYGRMHEEGPLHYVEVGGVVDFRPCRVLLDRQRPQAIR